MNSNSEENVPSVSGLASSAAKSAFSTLSDDNKESILLDAFQSLSASRQDEIMIQLRDAHRTGVIEHDFKFHYIIIDTPYNSIISDHDYLRTLYGRLDFYLDANTIEIVYTHWLSEELNNRGPEYMITTIRLPNNRITQSEEVVNLNTVLMKKILPNGKNASKGICFRLNQNGVRNADHTLNKNHVAADCNLNELVDAVRETIYFYRNQPLPEGQNKIEADMYYIRNILKTGGHYQFEIVMDGVRKKVLYLTSNKP